MEWHNTPKMLIVYCTLAGLISAWAISGLLAIVDSVSGTPPGTFFAVIGLSLGFNDPVSAQYIGLGLHILTGTVAGNILGQIALFWQKLFPYNIRSGVSIGLIVGVTLWAILFLPLATFGIQPRLDAFLTSAPNTYVNNISTHFAGLYPLIVGGSLLFHLIYGAILGLMAGRMAQLRLLSRNVIGTRIVEGARGESNIQ
jgi:hypothetical protein